MLGEHTYTQAPPVDEVGNPVPMTVSVTVTDNCGGGAGSGSGTVNLSQTLVSIGGTEAASEISSDGVGFYIERQGDTSQSLEVKYQVDSSLPNAAQEGTNYEALCGTATFASGESVVFVPLHTKDDHVAGWTKAVKVDLQADDTKYVLDPEANTATDEIVDSDLSIKLGDDSANQVLQGSDDGTQNLTEATLDFPQEARDGATVTLSEIGATKADIWASANPQAGDVPLLSADEGSVTLPIDQMSTHVWVGAIGASSAVGDFVLQLLDSEVGTTPAPANPTSDTATTKPASVIQVKITALNDPNGTGKSDWTDQTQNWLVGQMVDLSAEVDGPPALTEYANFNWDVGGNTLRDYIIDGSSARTVPLTADDNGDGNSDATPTGTSRQEVKFFWVSTSVATLDQPVSVTVDGVGGGNH